MKETPSQPLPLFTVSQLTHAIKLNLETSFPSLHLQGEVSNFKIQTSGHLYFSLKDANAQISAVMFKNDASLLKIMPKGGDQVVIKGALNVYPPKGNYQLVVRELSYVGIGELLQKLEWLKVKLHQLGWFKKVHKKPLPRFPRRIGVVTSPTGAVIQDILHILSRRFSGFHLILNPVKVQGEGAAAEIAQAIEQMNRYQIADVLIVGRGGGSLEDLWAFNEEIVASAIFHSQIPIISAVGHETDHCIADYVADVRAPTPSAAAEIVIAEKSQLLNNLTILKKRIHQTLLHLIQQNLFRLKGILNHPLFKHPHQLLEWRMQKLDDYKIDVLQSMKQCLQLKKHHLYARSQQALSLKPMNQLLHFKQSLGGFEKSLSQGMGLLFKQNRQNLTQIQQKLDSILGQKQTHLNHLFNPRKIKSNLHQILVDQLKFRRQKLNTVIEILKALDPKNILQKGYSILFDKNEGCVVNSIAMLEVGQQAKLLMSDGEINITINKIIRREN